MNRLQVKDELLYELAKLRAESNKLVQALYSLDVLEGEGKNDLHDQINTMDRINEDMSACISRALQVNGYDGVEE